MNFFTRWRDQHNAEVQKDWDYWHQFKPGAKVRLKTGGPIMIVKWTVSPEASMETGHATGVHCHWFDEFNRIGFDVFLPDQLEPANPPLQPKIT